VPNAQDAGQGSELERLVDLEGVQWLNAPGRSRNTSSNCIAFEDTSAPPLQPRATSTSFFDSNIAEGEITGSSRGMRLP
jgi:hypothetical protein